MKQFSTILMITLFISACSLFDENGGVELSGSSEGLCIDNNFDYKIYYFITETKKEPLIDWVPFQNDNQSIEGGDSEIIDLWRRRQNLR